MKELIIENVDGTLCADSRNVAETLGVEHKSILKLLREKPELDFSDFKSLKSSGGRPGQYALLTERQCLILITFVKNTDEAIKAKIALVDAFLKMEEYLRNKTAPLSEIDKSEKAASIYINLVRPSESGRMFIAHNVCKKHGLPVDLLPAYAEEKKTSSLSDLLKRFHAGLSAQAVNRKLVEKGILEHCKRKSSKGEKMFLSITKNGEAFGKNLISPQNPRETQPHWYEDKFPELLKMIA